MAGHSPYSMSEAEVNEAQEVMHKAGISGLKEHLHSKLEAWKSIPLNIAVTGATGTGKSTFINTMRGLDPNVQGAAAVGVTETTSEVKTYPHAEYGNFVLSDLPGVGTPNFPRDEYLKKVGFEKFDFFLIICSSRFTENDLWLANQARKENKNFYFIRTKIDIDIRNDRDDHPYPEEKQEEKEMALLEKVSSNCLVHLEEGGLGTENPIFLISGKLRYIGRWDFPALQEKLLESIPALKREALTLSLQCNSKAIVNRKVEALKARIWMVATMSAAGGAIPVPGMSAVIDMMLVAHEIREYKKQLGLDDKTLHGLAIRHGLDEEKLIKIVGLTNIPKAATAAAFAMAAEEVMSFFLPIAGMVVGAAMSFGTTAAVLRQFLSKLQKAALQIVELTIQASKS